MSIDLDRALDHVIGDNKPTPPTIPIRHAPAPALPRPPHPATPRPTQPPADVRVTDARCPHNALIEWAENATTAKVRTAAARTRKALADLQQLVADVEAVENAKRKAAADKARLRAQATELENQLAKIKEQLRSKTTAVSQQGSTGYDPATVRAWARDNNVDCPTHGRFLPRPVVNAWRAATGGQ